MSRLNRFLQGIKVVDLSRHLPGPLASLSMAEMGAEVIKVEPPGGEEMRHIGPQGPHGRSAYFDAVNGNKSGVQLDLKDVGDREHFLELIKDADVLMESFRPGVLARLDLSVEFLQEHNPRMVICSLNGYGSNSPLVDAVGHDLNYLAMNGVLEGTGTQQQAIAPWPPLADCSAGLYGLSTILAALIERSRTDKGCHVEVALADSVMPLMAFPLADLGLTGEGTPRAQSLLNGGAARYRTYTTKDGHTVALGGVEPKFWKNFCTAIGKAEWVERINEPLPQTGLQNDVAAWFAGVSLDEANDVLAGVDCCYNDVLPLAEAVATPHITARKLVVQNPEGEYQALYPAYVDGEAPLPRKGFKENTE